MALPDGGRNGASVSVSYHHYEEKTWLSAKSDKMAYALSGKAPRKHILGDHMDKKSVVCGSAILGKDMHVNVYGKKGLPVASRTRA